MGTSQTPLISNPGSLIPIVRPGVCRNTNVWACLCKFQSRAKRGRDNLYHNTHDSQALRRVKGRKVGGAGLSSCQHSDLFESSLLADWISHYTTRTHFIEETTVRRGCRQEKQRFKKRACGCDVDNGDNVEQVPLLGIERSSALSCLTRDAEERTFGGCTNCSTAVETMGDTKAMGNRDQINVAK